MKNTLVHFLAAIGSFGLAVCLMQGFITFSDPLSEMGLCVIALMMGSVEMFVVVEDIKKKFNAEK